MSWLRLLHPRTFLLAFAAIALMSAALVLPAAAQARVKLVRFSPRTPVTTRRSPRLSRLRGGARSSSITRAGLRGRRGFTRRRRRVVG
jgi:hypothetical protein